MVGAAVTPVRETVESKRREMACVNCIVGFGEVVAALGRWT